MSHTMRGPSGATYSFNGDFSGLVGTDMPVRHYDGTDGAYADVTMSGPEGAPMAAVAIPFEDIRALYLESRRREAISRLEQAEDDELEEMFFGGPQTATRPAPQTSAPQWVWDGQRIQQMWTRHILRQVVPYQHIQQGKLYVHVEQPWVLAHVDDLQDDGSVLFAVWNVVQGHGWQSGAGFRTHEEFQSIYPLHYTGVNPEFLNLS